jgi:uncharacterized protein YgiM (DUF1202 family)
MNAPSANVRWITDRRGLVRLFLLLVILSTSVQVLPGAPFAQPVLAAGTPCVDDGPSGGSYVARLCFTSPADGSTISAAEFTANVTVTSVVGTLPPITKVQFYLNVSTGVTHPSFMTDYLAPWTARVPVTHWRDRTYRLDARVTFSDNFTSTYANVIVGFATGTTQDQHSNGSWSPATSGASPLNLVAVGDGAGGLPGAAAVGNLISSMNPDLFFYLGDVYNSGTYGEFYNYYEPTLGSLKSRTNPIIGNHESPDGFRGFMDYWNMDEHYYSFNSGGWHFIGLDATTQYSQTAAGSEQYNWLAQDLATTDPNSCTMVFYHQPRWGLDGAGGNAYLQDIWSLLALNGVDVVLNGHEHNYQRWKPMDANGAQVAGGMVEYIVGTGGHELMGFAFTDNRVAYRAVTDGAMKLSLTPTGGTSAFYNTSGALLDSGAFTCDGSAIPVPPHDPNDPLTLSPVADANVSAANPDTNYGTRNYLHADTSPNEMSYLRFNVAGLTQPVTKATLRLWVRGSSSDGTTNAPEIAPCSDITWSETGITWNNKPAIGSPVTATGQVVPSSWVEYDVTSLITGNGQVSLALTPQSADAMSVNSRDNVDHTPQLVILQTGGTSTPPPGNTQNFEPVADAKVVQANPDTNYGTINLLNADKSPDEASYLRFNVSGLAHPITNATLRMWVNNGTANAPEIASSTDVTWSETGITWNNKPATGVPVTSKGVVSPNSWVEYDVTSLVTGNGLFTLVMLPDSTDAMSVNSRNSTSNRPQLVITEGTGDITPTPEPTVTPGTSATYLPAADARVEEANPLVNYGTSTTLRADAGPNVNTYIRFSVTGLTSTPTGTVLRLFVPTSTNAGSVNGPALYTADSTVWSETGISWASMPPRNTTVLGDLGPVANGTWIEFNVSSVVTGNGDYTFVLVTTSSDATDFSSRETANAPRLVVTVPDIGGASTPTATPATPTAIPATPTVTPTGEPGATLTFEPEVDAMVVQSIPYANYGTNPWLHTDLGPDEMSYLRFNVQGVSGTVSQATLRLWVRSGTANGPEVAASNDVTWSETGINWNNRPTYGSLVTTTGDVPTGTWLEYDVTSLITGNGLVTLALVPQSSDGISLDSREAASTRPQLVIQQSGGGGSGAFEATPEATPATPEATPATPEATPPTPEATPATPESTPATPEASPPSGPGESTTFEPVADAMVILANPDANLGTQTWLHADQNPQEMSYLRFDVQGIAEPVTQATLRLWVRSGTADGPEVAGSSDVGWSETGITWNNKPAYGSFVTSTGVVPTGVWVEYDVTSLVTGNGLVTFALVSESNDGISFNSRENAGSRPQLIIGGSDGGSGGGDEPPATPDATPNTPGATPDATPGTPDTGPPPDSDGVLTFGAQADAMVALANPDTNYGTSGSLHADQSPEEMSYLRFDVQGVADPVTQATLRLWVRSGTANGPEVASCPDVTWSESTITWNTKPACGSPVTATGGIDAGVWVEYDVTSLITGNGPVTLGLIPDSSDLLSVNSRRSASNPPELVVSTDPGAQGLRAALPNASPAASEPSVEASPVLVEDGAKEPDTGSPVAASPEVNNKAIQSIENVPTVVASPVEGDTLESTPPEQVTFGIVINTGEDGLRCRTQPSLDGEVIAILANDEQVAVRGDPVDGWVPVTCAGQPGYVAADYLQLTTDQENSPVTDGTSGPPATVEPTATSEQPGTPEPATDDAVDVVPTATMEPTIAPTIETTGPVVIGTGYVTGTNGDGVRCRVAASADADVVGVLEEGSAVPLLGDAVDGWLPVLCGNGEPGYVAAEFITVDGVAVDNPNAPTDDVAQPIEVPIPTETATVETQPTEEIVTEQPTPTEVVPTEVPEPEPYSIFRIKDSEQSDTGWKLTDEDASTYWTITPSLSPDAPNDVWLQIDLGEALPVDRVSWQLARSGFLPYTEIWLSADGDTWWNADQFNGWNLETDTEYESDLGVWTRYILFVIPDPVESGLTEFGGFSEIEVWPADDAQSVDTYASLVTPEPPPEPEIEPTAIPTEQSTEDIVPTEEPAVDDALPTEEPPAEDVVPTEAPPVDDLDPAPTEEVVPDDGSSSSGRVVDNQDGSEESSDGG